MSKKIYLYTKWVRFWHLLNALLFIVLIATGVSMQYSGRFSLISFDNAVSFHNMAAKILLVSYVLFVTGNAITSNGKYYSLKRKELLKDSLIQFRYYLYGIFREKKQPFEVNEENKFNPLQRLSYSIVIYILMPLLILSGIMLLFPELIMERLFGVSGFLMADVVHITMGFLLTIFMIIHIYTCTLGDKPGSLFRSLITGFYEKTD